MNETDKKRKSRNGKKTEKIVIHVIALFLVSIVLTGVLTYICENYLYYDNVRKQTEFHAAEIAKEANLVLAEYPAHEWLVRYWYAHSGSMDIEYDVQFDSDTETAEKCRVFSERHPELQLRYLSEKDCEKLPEEDKKLYAEIAYSWLITRINQIKRTYGVAFLFCVISEEPFDRQFVHFSGADEGAKRGTKYEEVYPLGNIVTNLDESQITAMREATKNTSHLASAGDYVDYYALILSFDEHNVLIGLTYDVSVLLADIDAQTRTGATLAIINQFVLAAICLTLIILLVIRPLKKLQNNIRRYKETKDSEQIIEGLSEIRSKNEIGQLARDTSDMIREIDAHIEKIQTISAEKERIVTELSLAQRIQVAMLPSNFPPFPGRTEFDIFASMDPATEVGGDFYDFFLVDEDHLGLVIADVSGKGIPAALFMMISKILVKNYVMTGLSPAKALEAVNRQICANNREEMFVTVWLGVLEISTGKLTAANAGHEYPVLKNADGAFEFVKDKHGLVVGAMDIAKYKEYELQMQPGSKLFVYTDGVPEATDAGNNMFGGERLLDALNKDVAATPEQILKNVRGDVNSFVKDAEQFDDLTMLCIKYKAK